MSNLLQTACMYGVAMPCQAMIVAFVCSDWRKKSTEKPSHFGTNFEPVTCYKNGEKNEGLFVVRLHDHGLCVIAVTSTRAGREGLG